MKWFVSIILLLSCAVLATAADVTRTWNNAGTDWADGANWNGPIGFPGDSADNIAEFGLGAVTNQPNLGVPQSIKRLIFTGAGDVTISGSALTIGDALAIVVSDGTTTHTIACDIVLGTNATVQVDGSLVLTITGAISGTGSLTKTGTGTLILSGSNSYTGTTTVSAGTLRLGANGALPAANALSITAGTFDLSGFDQTVGAVTTSNGTTIAFGGGGGSLTVDSGAASSIAGAISGTGDLASIGAGVLTLSGANSYVGGTAISNGTLRLGASNAVPAASPVAITAGGTLSLNNFGQALATLTAAPGTFVTLGSGTLTVNGSAASVVAAAISGSGAVVKSGAGTLTLSGGNGYTGTTTVNAGTLRAEHATALGTGAAGTTVAATATLTLANNITVAGESLALDGTLRFDSATGSALNGAVSLTIGGTPAIEVLQGVNTIGTEVQVNADVAVLVLGGSALTVSDTEILGNGLISRYGGGTLSFGDITGPGTPSVSVAATSTSATPTWSWSHVNPSGAATYRYRLDNIDLSNGTTTVTTTSYLPGTALSEGSHILYVQERDAVGNWSTVAGSATTTIDSQAPYILSRVTRDDDGDGQIEYVLITFSENMAAGLGTWSVVSGSTNYAVAKSWPNVQQLRLTVTELTTPDTGVLPVVTYTFDTGVTDVAGNKLAGSAVAATDDAAPVIVSATGTSGGNTVTLTFSEPVVTTVGGGNLLSTDFTYTGGGAGILSFSDANALDGTVTFTTSGVIGGSDTVAAQASQIFDLAGKAMLTAARPVSSLTQWHSGLSATSWTVGPWYTDSGRGTPRAGYPSSQNDAAHIYTDVTVDGGFMVGALVMKSASSLSCTIPNQFYLTITAGTRGSITAEGTARITNLSIFDNWQGLNIDVSTGGTTLTIEDLDNGGSNPWLYVGPLIKSGAGTLELNRTTYSAYSGEATLSAGTLRLMRTDARLYSNPFNIASGATLDLAVSHSTQALNGTGTVTVSGASRTLTIGGGSFAGQLNDNGASTLALNVAGTAELSGVNGFTGGANVQAGTLTVSGGSAIADGCPVALAGGSLAVSNGETIASLAVSAGASTTLPSGITLTVSGASAISAGWSVSGGGSVAFTNAASANSGAGAWTVTGSTVRIARGDHLTGTVSLSSGTLAADGNATLTQTVALAGAGTLEVAAGRTMTASTITGANGLTKDGAGTLAMGSTSCSQTSTTIRAGTLRIGDYRHLGAGAGPLSMSGGTLAVTADVVATSDNTVGGTKRQLTLTGSGAIAVDATRTLNWPGLVVSGAADNLGKAGAGTLVLGGANAGLAGPLSVDAGRLQLDDAGALGGTANGSTVADGASLLVNGGYALSEPITIAGDGVLAAGALRFLVDGASVGTLEIRAGATHRATVSVEAGTATVNGVITGNGGLDKIGAGILELTQNSTFTGPVDITAGTIRAGADGHLGDAGNDVVLNGGTLALTANVVFASRRLLITTADGTISTGINTLTVPGLDTAAGQDLALSGTGGLIVDAGALVNGTIAGALSGSAGLTKTGAGVLTLQSLNDGLGAHPSFTGPIAVGGTGVFRINGSVHSSSICTVASGAILAGNGKTGVLQVSGTVRPGGQNAAGVLSAASLAVNAGAALEFDLGTANDQIAVDGAATVDPAAELRIAGFPTAGAFGTGDYTLVSSGGMTYSSATLTWLTTSGVPIAALVQARYRLLKDGVNLVLQTNRAPSVATGVADAGGTGTVDTSTTPPSYTVGPPGSAAVFNDDVAGSSVIPLVQASDPEGAAANTLTFTLKLDPSQGLIEWDSTGAGAWQTVSADGALKIWTQADVASGRVRYRNTGSVGGNDAILYDVRDALGATSPLYLMRFTIQGSGPPVISGLPAAALWLEQSTKPGPWSALAPTATLAASTDPLDGGLLKVTLLNGESGDELSFVGNGVALAGDGTVSLSGTAIGSLVATTSSLTVTLNANATQARVTALLQAASFRTSNSAPVATGRSIELRANDGSIAGGTTIVAFPLNIDLYNDAPTLSLTVDVNGTAYAATAMPGIPNLLRTGTVTPSDPEGELAVNVTMTLFQGALQGTLVFNPNGTFSYRPNFLPGGLASDVLEDSFIVTVTDRDFSVSPSATRVDGVGAASRYDAASRQVTVPIRIAAGGAGLAFLNVPRMTVDNLTSGSFSYTPQLQLPSGAGTVRFELIDVPGAVTLGTGAGQLNFSPSTGVISWPAVPPPAGTLPQYWRFGILATDPTTGSAALLPVMLRVGTGGTNG